MRQRQRIPLGNDNELATNSISTTWDAAPTVALTGGSTPTNTSYPITITFSEAINPATFGASNIAFAAGAGSASAPSTSDNITWTSTITPTTQATTGAGIILCTVTFTEDINPSSVPSPKYADIGCQASPGWSRR